MKRLFSLLILLLRFAITACAVVVAMLCATALWRHYMISPWTRDGRVRVETVIVAPEVSGQINELMVADNQFVHKGDPLFVVDSSNYRIAVGEAQAALDGQTEAMRIAQMKADSRAHLSEYAISREDRANYDSLAQIAVAAVDAAKAQLEQAKINLGRTTIRSPVNGYVTNLHLRVGNFATTGQAALAIVDSDSYWVAGYFEETQLAAIHPGDRVEYVLMGYPDQPVHGHIDSLSRGIADQNADGFGAMLPSINPVFTWVRLAQRIPVRVAIDPVPDNIVLTAGMTATISVGTPSTIADDFDFAIRFWTNGKYH